MSRRVKVFAAIAILAAAAWLALPGRRAAPSPQRVVQGVSSEPRAASTGGSATAPPSRLRPAAPAPQGAANALCAMPYAEMTHRTYGARPEDPEKPEDLAAREARERTAAYKAFSASVRRIDAALRASPDPYANAVGIWLNLPRDESGEEAVSLSERRRELAALAAQSTDPRIYELAFLTCRRSSDADGCHVLSARRWVDLDPGNALPWAVLLEEAIARGDVSGQENALFQMSKADRYDTRTLAQLAPIISASDGSPADQAAAESLSVLSFGIVAAWPLPFAAWRVCAVPAARADLNRAQLCISLANVMFEHSDSLQTRSLGATLTKRLSGDPTRSAIVNRELDASTKGWKEPAELNCEALDAKLAFLARAAVVGQPRALHEAMSNAER